MITITQFSISNDLLEMDLAVSVDATQRVTSLKLWTDSTFKDPDLVKDLSSKLSGTSENETIKLVPSDIGATKFTGMYFLQIESDDVGDNPAMVAAVSLVQFYGVVTALLFTVNTSCLNCNTNLQNALLLDMYIEGIKSALRVGRFRDAITFFEKINIITNKTECSVCDQTTINSTGDGWVSVGVIDCTLIASGANI